jgi:hypothetical protein
LSFSAGTSGSGEDGDVFWATLPSAAELLKLNCPPAAPPRPRYFAAARAAVDASWGVAPSGAQPEGPLGAQPQGHLAQVGGATFCCCCC